MFSMEGEGHWYQWGNRIPTRTVLTLPATSWFTLHDIALRWIVVFLCIVVLYYCHYLCSWFLAVWPQCSINLNLNLNSKDHQLNIDHYCLRTNVICPKLQQCFFVCATYNFHFGPRLQNHIHAVHHNVWLHNRDSVLYRDNQCTTKWRKLTQ